MSEKGSTGRRAHLQRAWPMPGTALGPEEPPWPLPASQQRSADKAGSRHSEVRAELSLHFFPQ